MSGWLRHIPAWLAILAFALGAKLHLPAVQLAAWTSMAAGYAEVMPLDEAVRTAVAGEELCGGCRFVRSAEHARQAGDALLTKALGASADLLPAPEPDALGTVTTSTPGRASASASVPPSRSTRVWASRSMCAPTMAAWAARTSWTPGTPTSA